MLRSLVACHTNQDCDVHLTVGNGVRILQGQAGGQQRGGTHSEAWDRQQAIVGDPGVAHDAVELNTALRVFGQQFHQQVLQSVADEYITWEVQGSLAYFSVKINVCPCFEGHCSCTQQLQITSKNWRKYLVARKASQSPCCRSVKGEGEMSKPQGSNVTICEH